MLFEQVGFLDDGRLRQHLYLSLGITASSQPSTVEGLFSNGYDLVEYFIRDANAKMSTFMNEKAKK